MSEPHPKSALLLARQGDGQKGNGGSVAGADETPGSADPATKQSPQQQQQHSPLALARLVHGRVFDLAALGGVVVSEPVGSRGIASPLCMLPISLVGCALLLPLLHPEAIAALPQTTTNFPVTATFPRRPNHHSRADATVASARCVCGGHTARACGGKRPPEADSGRSDELGTWVAACHWSRRPFSGRRPDAAGGANASHHRRRSAAAAAHAHQHHRCYAGPPGRTAAVAGAGAPGPVAAAADTRAGHAAGHAHAFPCPCRDVSLASWQWSRLLHLLGMDGFPEDRLNCLSKQGTTTRNDARM